MEAFIAELNAREASGEHPVLVAAWLHDELVRIHPFIDGNGRTSRLMMNLWLVRHGYPVVSLKGDNDSKLSYYKALERSHIQGDRADFNTLVAEAVESALARYISFMQV